MTLERSTIGRPSVMPYVAAAVGAAAPSRDIVDPVFRGRKCVLQSGFTLVELMTVAAVIGILASLILSAVAGTKKRSRQTTCSGNLRQIALAVAIYEDEAGRRPRSYTRLASRPEILPNPRSLLCTDDPAVRAYRKAQAQANMVAWGNLANTSQEPMERVNFKDDLEAPSWELEMQDTRESIGFSYLHPLFWRKSAWKTLLGLGNQAGVSVCQTHGVSLSNLDRRVPAAKPYLAWEGLTLRAQRDGAVVARKIFRGVGLKPGSTDPSGGVLTPVIPGDYPWEFYLDQLPLRPKI